MTVYILWLRELKRYVRSKPQIVAATKMDAVSDTAALAALEAHVRTRGLPFLRISAVSGQGLDVLQEAAWKYLSDARTAAPLAEA